MGYSRKRGFLAGLQVGIVAVLLAVVCISGISIAGEERTVKLAFAAPEGMKAFYKATSQIERNYSGIDFVMNTSSEIETSYGAKNEDGNYEVVMEFKKFKSGIIRDDEIMDWDPPVKFEGKTVHLVITPKGKIESVSAGSHIPGLKNNDQLKQIIDPYFMELPDSQVTVGGEWKKEILKEGSEGEPPKVKGSVDYKLKKIETKKGIEVACIEWKSEAEIYGKTGTGYMEGKVKARGKAFVALDGGYVVELKWDLENKMKIFEEDPLTGKVKESGSAEAHYYEIKLEN